MRPTTPIIDPRTFQDLVDEAKRRIPQYCPEWTDHNVADPGITLIELFAWMVDLLLYRLNQVPERDYLKFLELIGARPEPAVPASAELTFWLTAPPDETKVIRRGTEIATRQTETRPEITFTTDTDLRIRAPVLRYCILARQRGGTGGDSYQYEDVSARLGWERAEITVFQEPPVEGDAFYLGFQENLAGHVIRLNVRCETLRAPNINQDDPPLTWEFWNGGAWAPLLPPTEEVNLLRQIEPECAELGPRLDDTRGLNRNGRIILVVPRTCALSELRVDNRALEACWIRCRAARRRPDERFYDGSPIVHAFLPESIGGMVMASHAITISNEELGRSDGTPGQSFSLLNPPILPRRTDVDPPETIEIDRGDGQFERWIEVEDFSSSSPTDPHFVVDSLTGEVRFGPRLREPNGQERQYGRVPPKNRLIRFTHYRSGGGAVGNVGRGTLVIPKSSQDLSYVKWVANLAPATGGRDRESIDAFKLRGPRIVRTREVAVTRSDYEILAREASPQAARVRCLAVGAPPDANGAAPRHVRLLIVPAVPTRDEKVPRNQLELPGEVRRELCRKVRAYLEERCPLGTELAVSLPDYRWISIRARLIVPARPDLEAGERERWHQRIRDEARRRLYRFVHPVAGGPDGDGWPFGRSLTPGDIYPILQAVEEVRYVEEVRFRVVTFDADGSRHVGPDQRIVRLGDTEVACSDDHEIEVIEE
ncbi:MAG TPA: putative baseplate assembly protein [Chloroflexota bacterium]|nr:putative baseplate assembly protein [Chloroflexota bacterium]